MGLSISSLGYIYKGSVPLCAERFYAQGEHMIQ